MQLTASGLYEYELETTSSSFRATLRVERECAGVDIVRLTIDSDVPAVPPVFKLIWDCPVVDVQGLWHPTALYNKTLHPDWSAPLASNSTYSAPVACLFSAGGRNRLTFAFSDVLNHVKYDAGVNETNSMFSCYIRLFDTPTSPLSHYDASLRVDKRELPFYEALDEVSRWWESFESNKPASVPAEAEEPMYSTWYTFHQQITPEEIEEQCKIARTIGCSAVIVDDGWHTTNTERGYAYCGDWQVSEEKIPDMKAHVERVHALGMKYLLWYSVAYVGYKSGNWEKFKDKMLYEIESVSTGVLDPRFPEVREFLIGIYEKAVLDWDLDGIKLDFVDQFRQQPNDKAKEGDGRDYLSVPQAVDVLLSDVIARLRMIKPSFMVEFRQNYISPLMRKYGNMFRAADCPNDAVQNRVRTIDVRLLCGNTAAHSDMMMWNAEEPVESAALQIINVLFSVPQISVRLDLLPDDHLQMVSFWLNFWREHREVLLHGKLMPQHPELLYPIILAKNEECFVAALYSEAVVPLEGDMPRTIILINGTRGNRVVIQSDQVGPRSIHVMDCRGKMTAVYDTAGIQGLQAIDIPSGGIAKLIAED